MGWGGDCNVWKLHGCNSKRFLHVCSDRMCVLKVPYAKMYFSGSPNLLLRSFRCEPQTCLPSNMPPKCHPNVLHGRPRFGPSFALSLICVCVCACAFFFLSRTWSGWSCFTGKLPGMCHLCKGGSEFERRPSQLQATAP